MNFLKKFTKSSSESEKPKPKPKYEEIPVETVHKLFRKHQTEKRVVDLEGVEKILKELKLHNFEYMHEFKSALYDHADQLDLHQFTNVRISHRANVSPIARRFFPSAKRINSANPSGGRE